MSKKSTETTAKRALPLKLAGALILAAGVITGTILASQNSANATEIVVYKSPTCGCCSAWIEHLKENGFKVEIHNRTNMSPIKAELGVPQSLQSCHTAKVGDYVIEGHVPADLISRLLQEKPRARGLSTPGMPMGSPGMEGPRKDPYDVVLFEANGSSRVYAHR